MNKLLIILILIAPLLSNETEKESIDHSKYKWYVGIASGYSPPSGTSSIYKKLSSSSQYIYFGNLQTNWEYSLGLDYGIENELEYISIDYDFNNNYGEYINLNDRDYLQDDQEGYGIGIGLKKYFYQNTYGNITTSFFSGLNLTTSILRVNQSYKYDDEGSSTSILNTYQIIKNEEDYSGVIFLGYNTEIFFKNNFSISFLSSVNFSYTKYNRRSQSAQYDEDSILIDLSDDQDKSENWNASLGGFRWMLKYYFPVK